MKIRKFILWHITVPNVVTSAGMASALLSCYFAVTGDLRLAVILLMLAGLCDLFDGVLARYLKVSKGETKYGVQLDTLIDMLSFGVTPLVIVASQIELELYVLPIFFLYLLTAATRLAHFNAFTASDGPTTHYQGVPVTNIALVLPIILLFGLNQWLLLGTLLAMSLLFVLNFKVKKLKGTVWYIVALVITLALAGIWWFM